MGKFTPNAQKLGSIIQYFQKSRVAHNIKDLEKHLPSVASINGMQVKDYLQALSDENKIHVEKIGSGNWYWSFASEDKKTAEKSLEDAQTAHGKAAAAVQDLKDKLAEARAHCDEDGEEGAAVEKRGELVMRKALLEKEVEALRVQVGRYSDTDPAELERKKSELGTLRAEAESCTDDIYSMEGWFRGMGQDEEGMRGLREMLYGDELDAEDGVLKELP